MGHALRHVLLWIVTIALVAGGAAYGPCAAMQPAAPMAAYHEHHDAAVHSHHSAGHHAQHEPAAPATDHGCGKCCAMCAAANVTLPVAGMSVSFTVSPVAFHIRADEWTANAIAVDPGIPKHIA